MSSDPTLDTILPGLAIAFVAGILKGSIGFGFPTLGVPLLAFLLGPRAAVAMMAVPLFASNALLLVRRPVDLAALRRFLPLLATYIPFTIAGSLLLSSVSVQVLALVVGAVATGFAVLSLSRLNLVVEPHVERVASPLLGIGAGLVNGATSIPGPLFALYLHGLKLEKRAFVYGITLIFAVGNVTQLVSYTQLGLYSSGGLVYALLLVPAALVGQQIGFYVQDRLEPERFRRFVVIVVALIGVSLLARGLGLV